MSKALGKNQVMALDALHRRGAWPGGWYITNSSDTIRVLDSLVRLGFVAMWEVMTTTGAGPRPSVHYRITESGRAALEALK